MWHTFCCYIQKGRTLITSVVEINFDNFWNFCFDFYALKTFNSIFVCVENGKNNAPEFDNNFNRIFFYS